MDDRVVTSSIRVFLSYSSRDAELATRLATDLRALGIRVWLDQWELIVGTAYDPVVTAGVDDAEFLLVLLTEHSVASPPVISEWERKLAAEAENDRIAVIPIRGGPCRMPDLFAQRSHVDVSGGSYPLGFTHLLGMLGHYTGSDDGAATEPAVPDVADRRPANVVAPIVLEVASDLTPLFADLPDGTPSDAMAELVPAVRAAVAQDLGVYPHGIRVRGNETGMAASTALIMIDEVPTTVLQVRPTEIVADATVDDLAAHGISGRRRDDVLDIARSSIAADDRGLAARAGIATWDAAEYLCVALYAVLAASLAELVDIDTTHRLVHQLRRREPALVDRVVPAMVSWYELTDVLRRLIEEGVGVGDLSAVLTALGDLDVAERDTGRMTEHVRPALREQITAQVVDARGRVPVIMLSDDINAAIAAAVQHTPTGSYLAIDPDLTEAVLGAIRTAIHACEPAVAAAVLTTPLIRRYVRKLVEIEFPALRAVAPSEILPQAATVVLATAVLPGPGPTN